MRNFADVLIEESHKKNTVLVVGLDPNISKFPKLLIENLDMQSYQEIEDVIFQFNKIVIDATHDQVVAVKPQLAYYEVYGSYGIRALERTIRYAKEKGLIVICDAKRNDISSSSEAYASAFLGNGLMNADIMTVNPYLGSDGYEPFIQLAAKNNKAIFLLLKTSNPSSREIQDLKLVDGTLVYHKLALEFQKIAAKTVGEYNYSFVGVVVGATYPEDAKKVRQLMPNALFLIPGLGAQGGTAEDLKYIFDENGNGGLVSFSRGIIYAYEKMTHYELTEELVSEAIRKAAVEAKEEINKVRIK